MKKIAILIDWENTRKQIFEAAATKLNKKINYNHVDNVLNFVKEFIEPNEEIYRIFVYLSRPLDKVNDKGTIHDFSSKPVYNNSVRFIENITQKELVAVREGKLRFRGFRADQSPIFIQKQVDMLMGLDISHLSYYKLVDRILIFSYDTDFVPALKIARTHGIQMCIGYCSDIQDLHEEVKTHSDFLRDRKFISVFP